MPVYTLRPNTTVSNAWTVSGAATAHEALDDAIAQPTVPTETDSVNTSTATSVCEVGVADHSLGGEAVSQAVLWVYAAGGSKRSITVDFRDATASLGTVTVGAGANAAWFSVTHTGTLTQQQVNDLRCTLTCNSTAGGGGASAVAAYVAYVDLTAAPTAPGAPTGVTATAGNASAEVSWIPPANSGGAAITNYTITPYVGATPQATTTVGNVTSTTITGLTNGTTYTFTVKATNSVGTGPESAASNAVTPVLPAAGRPVNSDGTISVTFDATQSWTVPPGVHNLTLVAARGGGGQGGASGVGGGGGGGGGGAYAASTNIAVTPGSVITITVGGQGQDSSFGTTVIAKAGGGGGSGSATSPGTAGVGGSAASSTGTTKFSGGNGAAGTLTTGGGGGGGAGDAAAGSNGTGTTGGAGGSAGGGTGGSVFSTSSQPGAIPSGGGGGQNSNVGTRGAGARGSVVVSYVETAVESTLATHAQRESFTDAGTQAVMSLHTEVASFVDAGIFESLGLHAGLDALFDSVPQLSSAITTGNWKLISPGLSGVAYDGSGTNPRPGAQVIVFRDDTNEVIATLTTDAAGAWSASLSPSFAYWISYWSDEGANPNIFGRTDRGLVPIDTAILEGT